ncbi:hypothetical protein DAPPUDRAFT_241923 [Daphnia pulex]|uniref:Uncharacterized protein n=1 Tax=Daphnia pulex TaxID=6669 RepID=E9GFE3_DAPPU|nr:hypothetical protein DAPPUDRAFT_241923 [Daphnia pulex]|eukprot:EFX81626.1 hypothetical protein DAPPUDRAFT_241923 [Daphnia pulex]
MLLSGVIVDCWIGTPLVFRCLLGMAYTKPQRRLTNQKQLTVRPVTAPRPSSTTPLRYWCIIPQHNCPSYYTDAPKYNSALSYTSKVP